MNFIFGTLLTANGNLKVLNSISAIGIVANILINVVLIPQHGALGAAIATFATQGVTAIAQFIYCIQKFKIPKKPTGVIKFIVLSACLYYISSFFYNSTHLIIIQIITGTGLIFMLSLIDLKAIKKLILTSR